MIPCVWVVGLLTFRVVEVREQCLLMNKSFWVSLLLFFFVFEFVSISAFNGANNQWVGGISHVGVFARVVESVKDMSDAVHAGSFFVIRANDHPRSIGGVRMKEHGFAGFCVVFPFAERLKINGAELPLLERIVLSGVKPAKLFLSSDGEPILKHEHA